MTKQEAQAYFDRNPSVLRVIEGLNEDSLLVKLDAYYPMTSGPDVMVNALEAYHAYMETDR